MTDLTTIFHHLGQPYDAPQIHAFSRAPGHVPIIDPNPRGGEKLPLAALVLKPPKPTASDGRP